MYGKLPERKLNQQDYLMNCEVVRTELADYINEQAKRVNQDSAKKRAVLQHMDYEGFRQMVLGANLFSLKTRELLKFSEGNPTGQQPIDRIVNSATLSFNNKRESEQLLVKHQQTLEQLLQGRLTKETACNNFSEFKKHFSKWYAKELSSQQAQQLYQLIKDQSADRLAKIFGSDFDPVYLTKICEVFECVLNLYVLPERNISELLFMSSFLQTVAKLKNIEMLVLKLLSKAQRDKISRIILAIQQTYEVLKGQTDVAAEQDQQIRASFEAVKAFYLSQ